MLTGRRRSENFVEKRVKEDYRRKVLEEAREIRNKMKTSVPAYQLIRGDRDER